MSRSEPVLAELGRRLRAARLRAGMTQEQVTYEVGCTRVYASMLERGKRNVTLLMLLRFARVIDCDPGDLLRGLHEFGSA
jgi:transcriptional regulator with XRE-family HTH domain